MPVLKMKGMTMVKPKQAAPEDCATVWFARLERAKDDHDFEGAAEAVRQLKRLGVDVKFTPDTPARWEAARHA